MKSFKLGLDFYKMGYSSIYPNATNYEELGVGVDREITKDKLNVRHCTEVIQFVAKYYTIWIYVLIYKCLNGLSLLATLKDDLKITKKNLEEFIYCSIL